MSSLVPRACHRSGTCRFCYYVVLEGHVQGKMRAARRTNAKETSGMCQGRCCFGGWVVVSISDGAAVIYLTAPATDPSFLEGLAVVLASPLTSLHLSNK